MPRISQLLLPPLLVLALASCGPAQETPMDGNVPTETTFFDLAGYIDAETERLTTNKITADKTITLNGTTEAKEDVMINYKNDLRLFREADINRPAWIEKYGSEEKQLSGSHKTTIYTALDSSLVVQRLLVEEDQGVPIRIEIDRKTGTVLSNGKHRLVYEGGKGYSVSTDQNNQFGEDIDAEITVRW